MKNLAERVRVKRLKSQWLIDEPVKGYFLVLPDKSRHWFGETFKMAANNLGRACDAVLNEKNKYQYWIDYCYGVDVNGQPAWANIDQSDDFI